jgi:glycine/D-amino acid oxidase-like deaminating enzyme
MTIARAACIGGGVIGAGWIARLVLNGIDVAIFDPDPEAARKVEVVLENARAPSPWPPRCRKPSQTPIWSRRACRNVWT